MHVHVPSHDLVTMDPLCGVRVASSGSRSEILRDATYWSCDPLRAASFGSDVMTPLGGHR